MLAPWPEADSTYVDADAEHAMNAIMDMVRGIRNVRAEYTVDPSRRIKAQINPGSLGDIISEYSHIFGRLCNVHEVEILTGNAPAEDSASIVVLDATIYLPLAGMVDVEAERQRLSQELGKLEQGLQRSQNMLDNPNFVNKARTEIVERERKNLAELQASVAQIKQRLDSLNQS
jgi:valyl-tRNA synthetase